MLSNRIQYYNLTGNTPIKCIAVRFVMYGWHLTGQPTAGIYAVPSTNGQSALASMQSFYVVLVSRVHGSIIRKRFNSDAVCIIFIFQTFRLWEGQWTTARYLGLLGIRNLF